MSTSPNVPPKLLAAWGDTCCLPTSLAREYAALWNNKATTMKNARTQIERMMKSESLEASFEKRTENAEAAVKNSKLDLQRYIALEKGYRKHRAKDVQ